MKRDGSALSNILWEFDLELGPSWRHAGRGPACHRSACSDFRMASTGIGRILPVSCERTIGGWS